MRFVTFKRSKARANACSARSTSISGVGFDKRPSARSFARSARSISMASGLSQFGVMILTLLF